MTKFKILGSAAILTIMPLATVVSCGTKTRNTLNSKKIMLVTDGGSVKDKSFNQQGLEGLGDIIGEKAVTADYLSPKGHSPAELTNAYSAAVKNGATTIITPGFYHVDGINTYLGQDLKKKTKFIIVDGVPTYKKDGKNTQYLNVASIIFKTKISGFESGYLAGL
jgi:basic membrane lipoprotein Med (substrate-binding protein (PBP1-ABC) superfamily)